MAIIAYIIIMNEKRLIHIWFESSILHLGREIIVTLLDINSI